MTITSQHTSVLAKFFQNLLFTFVFRNVADKEANIGNGYVDSEFLAGLQLIAIQLSQQHATVNNKLHDKTTASAAEHNNVSACQYLSPLMTTTKQHQREERRKAQQQHDALHQ